MPSSSSWNQSDQGLRQRRRLQQLDDRDGVGYVRGKVGWQRVGAGGWMGLHLPPHVSVVEPTPACRRPLTRAMPSRFGRARGLVAEWRVGMAALLRFVRGRPERDGAAVVVCSLPRRLVRSSHLAFAHSLTTTFAPPLTGASWLASSPRRRLPPPFPPSAILSVCGSHDDQRALLTELDL